MSTKSEEGFVRVKELVPYQGKGPDELVGALRRLLADPTNKYTQKIVLEVGSPHIYVEKLVKEGETTTPQLSLFDVIRNVEMEEYDSEANSDRNPLQQLWEMFAVVAKEELEVTAVVVGSKSKFQKWLGVRIVSSNPKVLGTPLHVYGDIPEDVFILCGATERIAEPYEIKFCVKGTIA